jgi:hypothetical protein
VRSCCRTHFACLCLSCITFLSNGTLCICPPLARVYTR